MNRRIRVHNRRSTKYDACDDIRGSNEVFCTQNQQFMEK